MPRRKLQEKPVELRFAASQNLKKHALQLVVDFDTSLNQGLGQLVPNENEEAFWLHLRGVMDRERPGGDEAITLADVRKRITQMAAHQLLESKGFCSTELQFRKGDDILRLVRMYAEASTNQNAAHAVVQLPSRGTLVASGMSEEFAAAVAHKVTICDVDHRGHVCALRSELITLQNSLRGELDVPMLSSEEKWTSPLPGGVIPGGEVKVTALPDLMTEVHVRVSGLRADIPATVQVKHPETVPPQDAE